MVDNTHPVALSPASPASPAAVASASLCTVRGGILWPGTGVVDRLRARVRSKYSRRRRRSSCDRSRSWSSLRDGQDVRRRFQAHGRPVATRALVADAGHRSCRQRPDTSACVRGVDAGTACSTCARPTMRTHASASSVERDCDPRTRSSPRVRGWWRCPSTVSRCPICNRSPVCRCRRLTLPAGTLSVRVVRGSFTSI